MANFLSTQVRRKTPIAGFGAGGGQVRMMEGRVTLPTSATAADTFQLFDLPPYAKVVDGVIFSDDLDTDGTPAILLDIGIAGTVDLFFADTTVGQAGTLARMTAKAAFDYETGGNSVRVFGTIATAADVAAAGEVVVRLFYLVNEPQ